MIETTIRAITEKLSPAKGHNLEGWGYDFINAFDLSDVFRYQFDEDGFVAYELDTKNKECMFTVHLKATKKASDINDVRGGLVKGWDFLQYNYFQASLIEIFRDCAILKFVTVISEGQYYVTGKAIVEGKRYRKLAKSYCNASLGIGESPHFC